MSPLRPQHHPNPGRVHTQGNNPSRSEVLREVRTSTRGNEPSPVGRAMARTGQNAGNRDAARGTGCGEPCVAPTAASFQSVPPKRDEAQTRKGHHQRSRFASAVGPNIFGVGGPAAPGLCGREGILCPIARHLRGRASSSHGFKQAEPSREED